VRVRQSRAQLSRLHGGGGLELLLWSVVAAWGRRLRDGDSIGPTSSGGVARRRQVAGAPSHLLPCGGRMRRQLLPCSPVDAASPPTSSTPPAHLVRLLTCRWHAGRPRLLPTR
jgi:hypothetical protein